MRVNTHVSNEISYNRVYRPSCLTLIVNISLCPMRVNSKFVSGLYES